MNKFRNTKLHRLERRNSKNIELHELANDPKRLKERLKMGLFLNTVFIGSLLFAWLLSIIF